MESSTVESAKDKILKPRFPRKRTYKKTKTEEGNNFSNAEVILRYILIFTKLFSY